MNHQPKHSTGFAPGKDSGAEIYALAAEIFPICRSITGVGVEQTLDILGRRIPLERVRIPTGIQLFDWTAPKEWIIRDAYIEDENGKRVLDWRGSNLHVLNYSTAVDRHMPLAELKEHVFTLPDQPDLIPYRTSYYAERWGFCMEQRRLDALPDGIYHAVIDADLADGHLTYGEYFHPGTSEEEFLLSAHICHPSLANDNCSGLALLTMLARNLSNRKTRHGYRFVFAPGTIGSLAWLAQNEERVSRIKHGLVVSCVGDAGGPNYKKSRRGNAIIDRAVAHVLGQSGKIQDFSPYGYDERQYCSPGFNLPVGLFQRSAFGTFPEYHTSGDNLDFISPEHLASSYEMIMAAIDIVEENWTPLNLFPKGEPQLGRRGLYASLGGDKATGASAMAMLWVLNLADGDYCLLSMAERSGLPFAELAAAARLLRDHELLAEVPQENAAR
jgi:aminopeptidase-like protein